MDAEVCLRALSTMDLRGRNAVASGDRRLTRTLVRTHAARHAGQVWG